MSILLEALQKGFEPDPDYLVSTWADSERFLSKKGSSEPGKYRTSRTPYMKEIMDALSIYSGVDEVVFMKPTQIGGSEGANNFFGYVVNCAPGPMLYACPTDELAKKHSRQKLQPSIDETPTLSDKIKEAKSRDSGNTILTKEFPGGILYLTGANSPASARLYSIRYEILDDIDGYPHDMGGEGDPVELFKKRTDSYGKRKKIFYISTPTIKKISRIESLWLDSDQRYYHVPCPFCGEYQKLEFGGPDFNYGIKFKRNNTGKPIAVWYECKFCHEGIDEAFKTQMLEAGRWVASKPENDLRGYNINAFYSPLGWVSWMQIVKEFLKAKGNPKKMMVWTNTRLGISYDLPGSQPEWRILKNRSEDFPILKVPDGSWFLSMGVDVQEDRFAVMINSWGPDLQNWIIYYNEIYGNPLYDKIWQDLDQVLFRKYPHTCGTDLQIIAAAIDAGYLSHHVYNYCRHRPLKTMAVKGVGTVGRPLLRKPNYVDVEFDGETIKDGCKLWTIGTDQAKTDIYTWLNLKVPGPCYVNIPSSMPDEFYKQITAEKRNESINKKGYKVYEWVKVRERNEALDCFVYSYAAAEMAGLSRVNWPQLIDMVKTGGAGGSKKPSNKKPKKGKRKARKW